VISVLDPLLTPEDAGEFVRSAQAFGAYRLCAEQEQLEVPYGVGLLPRHDAVVNFLDTRVQEGETLEAVGARTSYFREEYTYGDRTYLHGVAILRDNPAFIRAARALHDREVVVPAIVYANVMLPGQELAVHTDVPEFRGLDRKVVPQWFLVAMHHSGLFDDYRLPIATAVAYFGETHGGDLVYWPDGIAAAPQRFATRHNTAIVLDTDSVFHGVAPTDARAPLPPLPLGTTLTRAGDHWELRHESGEVYAQYDWFALRFSVSWKAYCFADENDRRRWADRSDDLRTDEVRTRFVSDLEQRGINVDADDPQLGRILIDSYIRFPAS